MIDDSSCSCVKRPARSLICGLFAVCSILLSQDSFCDPLWTDVSGFYRSRQDSGWEGSLLLRVVDPPAPLSNWSVFFGPVIGGSSRRNAYAEAEFAFPYRVGATGAMGIFVPTYGIGWYGTHDAVEGIQQTISFSGLYFSAGQFPLVIPLPTIYYRHRRPDKDHPASRKKDELGFMVKIPIHYLLRM